MFSLQLLFIASFATSLLKKFGNNGYANFFVEDTDYNNYLKELWRGP